MIFDSIGEAIETYINLMEKVPEELYLNKIDSMGLHLVKVLAEHQLDGKIEVDRTEGTQFKIKFKKEEYKSRI